MFGTTPKKGALFQCFVAMLLLLKKKLCYIISMCSLSHLPTLLTTSQSVLSFCLWWPHHLHCDCTWHSPLASFGALAHPLGSNIFITFQYFHHCCGCWQLLLPWAKVNQPPWLHQLVVLSIGWVGWFIFFFIHLFYRTLTSILPQSIVLAADLLLPIFSQPWSPYYPPT